MRVSSSSIFLLLLLAIGCLHAFALHHRNASSSPSPSSAAPFLTEHDFQCHNATHVRRDEGCIPRQCKNTPNLKNMDDSDKSMDRSLEAWLLGVYADENQMKELDNYTSILAYYGKVHWDDPSFVCNLNIGCRYYPNCQEVLWHQHRNPRGRSDQQIEDDTNAIFYNVLKIMAVNDMFRSFDQGLSYTIGVAGLVSDEMVVEFTRQPDAVVNAHCAMIDISVDLLFNYVGLYTGLPGDPVSSYLFKFAQFTKKVVEGLKELERLDLEILKSGVQRDSKDSGWLPTYPHYTDACSANKKENNFKSSAMLKAFVQVTLDDHRNKISKLWSNLIAGNGIKPGMQLLDMLKQIDSSAHAWSGEEHLTSQKEHIKTEIETYIISAAWRGGGFFIKCQEGGVHYSKRCPDTYPDTIRFCPDENTICQAEGYTTFTSSRNHEIKLYGLDNLEKWGQSAGKVMQASYKQYLADGNTSPKLSNMNLTDSISVVATLVVCSSQNVVVWDHEHNPMRKNGNMICTCGDWTSSDTEFVYDRIGLGKNSASYKLALGRDIYINTCQHELGNRNVPPLTEFLANCALGTFYWYPYAESRASNLSSHFNYFKYLEEVAPKVETDPHCSEIRRKVVQLGQSEKPANKAFCAKSWDLIFSDQQDHRNYWYEKCHKFRHNPEKWETYNYDTRIPNKPIHQTWLLG